MGLAVRTARRSDGMGKNAAAARSNKYLTVKTSRRRECQQAVNIERCARETRIRPSGTGTGAGWGDGNLCAWAHSNVFDNALSTTGGRVAER